MSVVEKKTILVIDDDITIRKLISHHLNLNNYNVLQAENADEGYNVLFSNKINLVLCDVMLGEIDGFTFCKNVRNKEKYRHIPFVFVTAKNTLEDKSRALEVGGDDYITKPFEIEELVLKVKALLRRSEIDQTYGVRKNLEQSFQESTTRIVLVDDDESLSKLFQYNLNKEGFDCRITHNADDGYKLIKSFHPDIIISDIMMPKIDGFQFRRMLLNDSEFASIPFIFFTAKSGEQDILEGYNLEITDYVIKTAGPKVVVAKVAAIVKSLNKERKKAVSELHQAADSMRAKVVPDNCPEFDGFKIEQWHMPYAGIPGGDFIDYIKLSPDHLAIILGDVMGKRWGAWYFAFAYAAYVRSAVRAALEEGGDISSPAKIIKKVNTSIYKDSKISEVFTTLSIIVLDKMNMILKYSGAGDLPLVFSSKRNSKVEKIQSDGILLGFFNDSDFKDSVINLDPGDCAVLATDGIIESYNKNKEPYSTNGLVKALANSNDSKSVLENIKDDVISFASNKFEDDISLITIMAK